MTELGAMLLPLPVLELLLLPITGVLPRRGRDANGAAAVAVEVAAESTSSGGSAVVKATSLIPTSAATTGVWVGVAEVRAGVDMEVEPPVSPLRDDDRDAGRARGGNGTAALTLLLLALVALLAFKLVKVGVFLASRDDDRSVGVRADACADKAGEGAVIDENSGDGAATLVAATCGEGRTTSLPSNPTFASDTAAEETGTTTGEAVTTTAG